MEVEIDILPSDFSLQLLMALQAGIPFGIYGSTFPQVFINLFSAEGVFNLKEPAQGLTHRGKPPLQSFSFPIRCVPIVTSKSGCMNSMFLKLH